MKFLLPQNKGHPNDHLTKKFSKQKCLSFNVPQCLFEPIFQIFQLDRLTPLKSCNFTKLKNGNGSTFFSFYIMVGSTMQEKCYQKWIEQVFENYSCQLGDFRKLFFSGHPSSPSHDPLRENIKEVKMLVSWCSITFISTFFP